MQTAGFYRTVLCNSHKFFIGFLVKFPDSVIIWQPLRRLQGADSVPHQLISEYVYVFSLFISLLTGQGINYKNYAEIVYLYYLNYDFPGEKNESVNKVEERIKRSIKLIDQLRNTEPTIVNHEY